MWASFFSLANNEGLHMKKRGQLITSFILPLPLPLPLHTLLFFIHSNLCFCCLEYELTHLMLNKFCFDKLITRTTKVKNEEIKMKKWDAQLLTWRSFFWILYLAFSLSPSLSLSLSLCCGLFFCLHSFLFHYLLN